jgi:hypothetical protein
VGDRVELDGVDAAGVEVQRRQDLVATRSPDDHDVVRVLADDLERQRPGIGVEAGQAAGITVVGVDGRASQTIVVEEADVAHVLHVDPEDRAPGREDGVLVRNLGFDLVGPLAGQELVGQDHG